jgi:hypothetical protein
LIGWHTGIDTVREFAEFDRAMMTMRLAQHFAALDVQGRKQRSGAMALLVGVRRSACPGLIGSNGAVRSSA